ncbi:MAG: RraA family protein [Acidobacteria bacterium]|nr:RraA family protein [Acidobacteriota bacterium]
MPGQSYSEAFSRLSAAAVADAMVRLKIPIRLAPAGIRPMTGADRVCGCVLPARHAGSVDVFLEAIHTASPGDVLVVDNGGRTDEGCIGDLVAIEAQVHGLAGCVIWGLCRDVDELRRLGFPVFGYGTCPAGPRRLDSRHPDALSSARVGDHLIGTDDVAVGDVDGVLFVPRPQIDAVLDEATLITDRERMQARKVQGGIPLWQQFQFEEYLRARATDSNYTFREHLRAVGGAVEE